MQTVIPFPVLPGDAPIPSRIPQTPKDAPS